MSSIVRKFANEKKQKGMNHLSRLLSILTILKSKRIVTGNELADKFDVSLRTIYRDIRKLEGSGVPLVTLEGRGYTIMEGYTVQPIMFDEEEVNALVTAEQLIAKTNDDSLISNFERTLTKIKSVFKGSLQVKGEILKDKMLILKPNIPAEKTDSLSSIQTAIVNFRVMEINYVAKSEESTFRKVEPSAVFSFDERWILIAWC